MKFIFTQAVDDDIGLNADIRYQILSRTDDDTQKFIIDPISGQIKTATSFLYNLGHVFGFDVKATDRAGGEDGKSAISNVFVSFFKSHFIAHKKLQFIMK